MPLETISGAEKNNFIVAKLKSPGSVMYFYFYVYFFPNVMCLRDFEQNHALTI